MNIIQCNTVPYVGVDFIAKIEYHKPYKDYGDNHFHAHVIWTPFKYKALKFSDEETLKILSLWDQAFRDKHQMRFFTV